MNVYDKKPSWALAHVDATHILQNYTSMGYFFAVNINGSFYPCSDKNGASLLNFTIIESRPFSEYHTPDDIKEPDHHQFFGSNSIDIIARSMTQEMWKGFCKGNALDYRLQQDIDKSNYYEELYEDKKSLCIQPWDFGQMVGRSLRIKPFNSELFSTGFDIPDVIVDHANNADKFIEESTGGINDGISVEEITQAEINAGNLPGLKDGEPCDHKGCLNHVTHPCESCGRIGGKGPVQMIAESIAAEEMVQTDYHFPHSTKANNGDFTIEEIAQAVLDTPIANLCNETLVKGEITEFKTKSFDITLKLHSDELGVHVRDYKSIHGTDYEDAKANAIQAAHDDGFEFVDNSFYGITGKLWRDRISHSEGYIVGFDVDDGCCGYMEIPAVNNMCHDTIVQVDLSCLDIVKQNDNNHE